MTGTAYAADANRCHAIAEKASVFVSHVISVLQQDHSHVPALAAWVIDSVAALIRRPKRLFRMTEYAAVDVDIVGGILLHVGCIEEFMSRSLAASAVKCRDDQPVGHIVKNAFLNENAYVLRGEIFDTSGSGFVVRFQIKA